VSASAAAELASDAVELAASLVGRPYVWGAEGPGAFDCSGLTQYVYGELGIGLPRRAISQSRIGDAVGRRLQRGDLVFFSSDARRSLVTHVGIYEGSGTMIDASKRYGRVRRDDLNDPYWAERFMFARRISEGEDIRDVRVPVKRAPPRGDRGRTAVRILERVADVLLRRSIHWARQRAAREGRVEMQNEGVLLIRPAHADDRDGIWAILEPVLRAGETYTLPRDISREEALAYWHREDHEVFIAEDAGHILGTYFLRANQAGGGSHVANCGYMTSPLFQGRGVARAMLEHSLSRARARSFHAT
jgi:RimJ/RimL family protein N-acetyltransferase